ncbi:hypothetical protein PsalMR5_02908 [Piscirickettsia salmonis]|uniref:transposase n=1 Tax=Piscirickettsia salmonis TaxID=1238 RepID=UPI0012BAC0DD|nr:transposase [Piscirickettsia salmonis]QGP58703.1 hypothetical protein PsalBI1_01283 [Piscirickettsia salmonis]QGP65027.1 hypothetical protein PsalMR5_02908 [Piscirickettsia salmonis]
MSFAQIYCLIPCLSPGETVIMDNASFHKSKGVKEAIEDAGCHLLFLPPYSCYALNL